MTEDDSGATDSDGEQTRDALEAELQGYNRGLAGGDIAIDLIQGRPLYIRRKVADTIADYVDAEDFDVATYKAHPYLPVTVDDAVFECVFVPTKPGDLPSKKGDKTYDYPRGRLARVPIEWLYDSDTPPQEDKIRACLAALFAVADNADVVTPAKIEAVAIRTFGEDAVDDAIDRAGIDDPHETAKDEATETAAKTDDELGDFDGGE